MKHLKRIFKITPFTFSVLVVLCFSGANILYDANPNALTFLSALNQKSLDIKFSTRGFIAPKNKIIIVAGDEKSFQTFGQWPWSRGQVFAPLLEKLCEFNTNAIGLDMVWSETEHLISDSLKLSLAQELSKNRVNIDDLLKQHSGDLALQKAIETCGKKLVMGYALSYDEGIPETDFKERMDVLQKNSSNSVSTILKGAVRYAEYEGDPNANQQLYLYGRTGLLNLASLPSPVTAQGFFNNPPDSDGNYRKAAFLYRTDYGFLPSLTLRMSQKLYNKDDPPAQLVVQPFAPDRNQSEDLKLTIQSNEGAVSIPIDLSGRVVVNYRGPNSTFPNVSIADVLDKKDTIDVTIFDTTKGLQTVTVDKKEFFDGASILVGITATGLYDIRPRPLDPTAAGVENHANILDNILAQDYLVKPKTDMLVKLSIAVFILSILYGWVLSRLNAKLGALLAIASIIGLLVFDQKFLFERNIVFSGYFQAMQFLFQYIGITVLKYMQEENEKKFIRSAFDKYVSPAVINQMLGDPSKLRLGGEKKELSILFSDVRGFTELSEKVDVKTLTQFLNEYLGAMTEILQANKGTLDKYIGDAVMGFWGAPIDIESQASHSVTTAIKMIEKLFELNEEFQKKYSFKIDIGIGINTGAVSVGNFGSQKVFEYTVIGDNVNLASRLEGLNKYYGTRIIISEATHDQLKKDSFFTRQIDTVKVKGKQKPVKIFEVFPDLPAYETLKSVLTKFEKALSFYYNQQWQEAIEAFNDILKIRLADPVSTMMVERCEYFKMNSPGSEWDGSWEMKSK